MPRLDGEEFAVHLSKRITVSCNLIYIDAVIDLIGEASEIRLHFLNAHISLLIIGASGGCKKPFETAAGVTIDGAIGH